MSGSVMTEQRGAVLMAVNHDGFLQLLDSQDEKHDQAHQRLRKDFSELEQRVEDGLKLLAESVTTQRLRLTEIANKPVDVSTLVLTPKIVASIIFVVVGVAGGMWASTSGLRSDMRDVLTRMSTDQRVSDANAKLLELNNATIGKALESNARELKESLGAVTKRQELQQMQIQAMQESIIRLTPQGRR